MTCFIFKHFPKRADYFLLRARCRKAQYAFKGSAQDYREAIRLDPLNAQSYLELGGSTAR